MNLAKKSVEDVDVKGKRVLMRVDFDVPLGDKGEITDNRRILEVIPTIKHVLDRSAKSVVLISHLGCPDGVPNPKYSLAVVAKCLEDLLKKPVIFLADRIGDKVEAACADPTPGSVILLENLRFHAEEEGYAASERGQCGEACLPLKLRREDIELFRGRLDALGDIFVNEALRSTHLEHSSIVGVDLPEMVCGLMLKTELSAFARVLADPIRPLLAIIGGEATPKRMKVIQNLVNHADAIIICGAIAFTFLKICHGMQTGQRSFNADAEAGGLVQEILSKAKAKSCEIIFPVDWVCGQMDIWSIKDDLKTEIFTEEQGIPEGWDGKDIGPKSVEVFVSQIFAAKTVCWNGAPGDLNIAHFSKGTNVLLDALASVRASGGFTVISGNDVVQAAARFDKLETVSFVSSSAEFSLELLVGDVKHLPGIAVLADKLSPVTWQGSAANKYNWDDARCSRLADEDMMSSDVISKYSWSDGKKRVSIYIELDGVDDMTEDAFSLSSGSRSVSLVIQLNAGERRTFAVAGLCNEITGAKLVQKKGKNMISLQLQKKEEESWPQLVEQPKARGDDDDS